MTSIGIGIVGAGYMGKLHSVAMQSVGSVFNTRLRPVCEMICTTRQESAEKAAASLGFKRSTTSWQELVHDDRVEAVVIASPQSTHLEIAEAAFAAGKPVLCEKPLGSSLAASRRMVELAEAANVANMVGFNYVRTPATQFVKALLDQQAIGEITWFRGEHTEDFLHDPGWPANWRTRGRANGTMGDLAPHMINCALRLMGPIARVCADIEIVHKQRPGESGGVEEVSNDDHGQFSCRFDSGVMGHLYFSRIATGRKMGYAYEITGTRGAIRFDQEDQNAIELYLAEGDNATRGFRKILTNPDHPDYQSFCQGPGHGTGFQDQLIIEARDFLSAIESKQPVWPTFRDGMLVNQVIEAAHHSSESGSWVDVSSF